MNIVSVFDGMACGMIAMLEGGVQVDRYVAYEIDKYATQTSAHNFPMIEHKGDVFQADFTEYKGFDWLVGGSPCTYWSIAQTKNRETTASGLGWELFSQYVRALKEIEPKYFIYENNKSMSNAIRQSITETFGFEPICINSALVSAQNRNRLYWVGIRQNDGTYKKANIEQPADRGILLKDILEPCFEYLPESSVKTLMRPFGSKGKIVTDDDKAHTLTTYSGGDNGVYYAEPVILSGGVQPLSEREMDYMVRDEKRFEYGYIQNSENDKAKCITANVSKGVPYNVMIEKMPEINRGGVNH